MNTDHLCACGCGAPVKENRRYVQGHHFRAMTKTLKSEPEQIVMRGMLGFIDDDGFHHQWQKGAIVSDPVEIAMIKSRKFSNYERL